MEWEHGKSPHDLMELCEIQTSALHAKVNKEKARLAILRTQYRSQVERKKIDARSHVVIKKTDIFNLDLVQSLTAHFAQSYQPGKCSIIEVDLFKATQTTTHTEDCSVDSEPETPTILWMFD